MRAAPAGVEHISAVVVGPPFGKTTLQGIQAHVRRDHIRWLVLIHLDAASPSQLTEAAMLPLVRVVYPDMTAHELQGHLDYLSKGGALTITDGYGNGHLSLTRHGTDLAQYTTPCPPGIGRPTVAGT